MDASQDSLDTITATGTAAVEVTANSADVLVTVTGSAAFGADQALVKAREVTALVSDLQRTGIAPDSIDVLGITTQASSGRLARSSSATYQLRVRTATVEQVPLVLDSAAGQKNAGIAGIVWRYPESAGRTEALQRAIAAAREAAAAIAQALGVELLQVHRFTEHTFDEEHTPMPRMAMAAAMAESAGPALDIDVLHRKTIRAQVELTYRIS